MKIYHWFGHTFYSYSIAKETSKQYQLVRDKGGHPHRVNKAELGKVRWDGSVFTADKQQVIEAMDKKIDQARAQLEALKSRVANAKHEVNSCA